MNDALSNFSQIFKRDGYGVSITFQGALSTGSIANTGIADANMRAQAAKAYLEVDPIATTKSQVNTEGKLTQGQSFILTGKLGSRQFDFSAGAHVSEMVTAIKNVAASTGIDAALTFNSNQEINVANDTLVTTNSIGLVDAGAVTNANIYENYKVLGDGTYGVIADTVTVAGAANIHFGRNTDGNGNIYAKYVMDVTGTNGAWEFYKDESLSAESLIGSSAEDGTGFQARNNSGFAAGDIALVANANAAYGDVVKINVGNVAMDGDNVISQSDSDIFDFDTSTAAGVQLGVNTDNIGKLYFKAVWGATAGDVEIYAYKDPLMREEDLVAKTAQPVTGAAAGNAILLDSIWNDEHTSSTGLGISLTLDAAPPINETTTFEIQFKNQGMRIFASEYGSDNFVQVQQTAGSLFTQYENAADAKSARVIQAGETFRLNGQDATVNVNGKQMKTDGLKLVVATQDIMANLSFNAGKTGTTTLAQVGYGEGSIFSKNTALTFSKAERTNDGSANDNFSALLNNACHTTQETVGNFNGGMQLQLGEGSGDQERTVIGFKSMAVTNLGRIEVTQQFDKSKAIVETRSVSVQDIMGGQIASLSNDPSLAMKVIEKTISDVSELRAQIGAVQANMLQANENNLRVAIENITKTESDIRDTDMAAEMTEFTKNQVLANAGVSMLSQANAQAQNVLQLLR